MKVKPTVQVLLSKRYVLECTKSVSLPRIRDQKAALDVLDSLQYSDVILRYPLQATSSDKIEGRHDTVWEPFSMTDRFIWVEESTPRWFRLPKLLLCAVVLGFLIINLCRNVSGKLYLKVNNLYGSFSLSLRVPTAMTLIFWICISPGLILVLRTILFLATHLTMSRGLWLFPRLLSENTFLGPFFPLFAWDKEPKEALGLRWNHFKKSMLADLGISKQRRVPSKTKMTKSQILTLQQR